MTVFTPAAVITDPATLAANAKAYMEAELPGWHAADGSIECIIIDAYSFTAAEQAEALAAELTAAYRSLGALVGVTPITAIPATASVTFTVSDSAGHTLAAANTIVGLRNANNDLQTFRLVSDVVVPNGKTTETGTIEATEPGTASNSLSGTAELVAAEAFVVSATVGTSGGGVDDEDEAVFLDRLTEQLAIQKPGPVLAADAAVIARSVPGVYRATAVDNLKPSSGDGGEGSEETNVEKCVTVSCVKEDGTACDSGTRAAVDALLQSLRETGFKFFVVAPHYTSVDVTATVFAWPGLDAAAVKAEVEGALEALLSPARWATGSSGNPETWQNDPILRLGEVFAAIGSARGVRWASAATFGKTGGGLSTSNLTLGSGSAVPALPTVGTLTITVEPTT